VGVDLRIGSVEDHCVQSEEIAPDAGGALHIASMRFQELWARAMFRLNPADTMLLCGFLFVEVVADALCVGEVFRVA